MLTPFRRFDISPLRFRFRYYATAFTPFVIIYFAYLLDIDITRIT